MTFDLDIWANWFTQPCLCHVRRSGSSVKVQDHTIKMFLFGYRCTLRSDVHSESPEGSTKSAHNNLLVVCWVLCGATSMVF